MFCQFARVYRLFPLAAVFVLLLTGLTTLVAPAWAQMDPTIQMALGNPDKASVQPSDRTRYLVKRPQYALSYNDDLRFPNWVAWHLSRQDIGGVQRGVFQPDPHLPAGFTRVTPTDYTRSGYDRGHNCPSKDRSATRQDNDAVFYMTNMTPQQHGMNGGPWNTFEEHCRTLAQQGNELYLYCGHGFNDRTAEGIAKRQRLGRNGVVVPDFGWKIALVLPEQGGDDLARITATTRVIAVRMPNISTISKQDWREFRTSVEDIEKATGLVFFDALPKETAAALKNRVDDDQASPNRRKNGDRGATSGAGSPPPTTPDKSGSGDTAGKVWVNTKSGVYWRPGTQYYGKTKEGKYMTEEEAKAAGYRAAKGQ
jgi:endonuclease G, mitochondrial